MKFFFWKLDNKEKFIRAFWTGLLALIVLYVVCWYLVDDLIIKIVLPMALSIIYLVDLVFRFKKNKTYESRALNLFAYACHNTITFPNESLKRDRNP